MKDAVTARLLLPFQLDLRLEPRIAENLRQEAAIALRRTAPRQQEARLDLPIVGALDVLVERVPTNWEDAEVSVMLSHAQDPVGSPFDHRAMGSNARPDGDGSQSEDQNLLLGIRRLPSIELREEWSRIYIGSDIKQHALNYCLLQHNLRKYNLSRITLAQHRLLIFYGPPGTGKTTLARGLANRFAEEMQAQQVYPTTYLEINAHRVPSKWEGDAQKAVLKLFKQVEEIATGGQPVICLLDEVESLLTNRSLALSESNPVDVFRAVNAVFQQLDRVAMFTNVYIFATSNLPKAIDTAFFDRADALFYIGLPQREERIELLRDIFGALNASVGTSITLPDIHDGSGNTEPTSDGEKLARGLDRDSGDTDTEAWQRLVDESEGLSGRHLRKLVAVAMASDVEVAHDPRKLQLGHVLHTLQANKERRARDAEYGGVYQ